MATNTDFISIPVNNNRDIHICGRCQILFYILGDFMQHKLTDCGEIKGNDGDLKKGKPSVYRDDSLKLYDGDNRICVVKKDEDEATKAAGWVIRSPKQSNSPVPHEEEISHSEKPIKTLEPILLGIDPLSKKEKFKCPIDNCSYSSFFMKDMRRHSRTHTGERPFKCVLCPKMFNRKDKLNVHLRIHNGEKNYKCSKCHYSAVESSTVLRHMRIHSGQKPFKCQLCSYSARDKSQLTVHLRMHTGDSPYICANEKCKAAFKTSTGLKRHGFVHLPKNQRPCPYCSFKASFKREWMSHVREKHSNEEDVLLKTHDCPHCENQFFSSKAKLKAHLKAKHGISITKDVKTGPVIPKKQAREEHRGELKRAYKCLQCEASFVSPESLRTHERQHDKKKRIRKYSPPAILSHVRNLDNNLKTAELLASLADDTRVVQQTPVYYSDDDVGLTLIREFC